MSELKVQDVALDKLKADPANARLHSERNLQAIVASLQEFGQRKPIVVTSDFTVVAGNGTLEAARRLGWKSLSVTVLPFDESERVKAYAIADNRSAELAEWNGEALLSTLNDLDEGLLAAAGFEAADLENLANVWGAVPDLDDIEAGEGDDDDLVRISFKADADVAAMWDAALKATGLTDKREQAALLVRAAWDALTDG